MSERTARWLIACGCVAAAIGGLSAALIGIRANNFSNIVVAGIFFGLAYGIYTGSRACAIIALALYLGLRIRFYQIASALQHVKGAGDVILGFWISVAVFSILYILGVIGTFGLHSRKMADTADD